MGGCRLEDDVLLMDRFITVGFIFITFSTKEGKYCIVLIMRVAGDDANELLICN